MAEQSPKHPNMAAALVAAQKHAQAVAKTSKNTFHGYKYASAEALIAEGREALADNGLAVMPIEWRVLPVEGIEGVRSKVEVTYMLVHESGASVSAKCETSILPEKGRPQDKAEATALTYNLGYYLRGLLLLPREEPGTSVDARDDRNNGPATVASHKPAPSQQPVVETPPVAESTRYMAGDILRMIDEAKSLADLTAARNAAKSAKIPDDAIKAAYLEKHKALKAGGST